jgi:hypothetical protein
MEVIQNTWYYVLQYTWDYINPKGKENSEDPYVHGKYSFRNSEYCNAL